MFMNILETNSSTVTHYLTRVHQYSINVFYQVVDRLRKMNHTAPLSIFLRQEIDRMQRVLTIVRNTLTDLRLAIDGTIIMSENLRDALDNMFDARIPNTWKKVRDWVM